MFPSISLKYIFKYYTTFFSFFLCQSIAQRHGLYTGSLLTTGSRLTHTGKWGKHYFLPEMPNIFIIPFNMVKPFIGLKQQILHKYIQNTSQWGSFSHSNTIAWCKEQKAFVMEGIIFIFAISLTATVLPQQGYCFNLDLDNYTELSGPDGSYFGFSVDFIQTRIQG